MTLAVHQGLSPLFVPPLLQAYDSGAQVIIEDVQVDQAGITTSGGRHIGWRQVESVRMHHPSQATAATATLIELHCLVKDGSTELNPDWIPSGIFLGRRDGSARTPSVKRRSETRRLLARHRSWPANGPTTTSHGPL